MLKDEGIRTVNERKGQFSVTLPRNVMIERNYRNKERVQIFTDENGNIIIKKIGGLVE
jgi:hypothetical protein